MTVRYALLAVTLRMRRPRWPAAMIRCLPY